MVNWKLLLTPAILAVWLAPSLAPAQTLTQGERNRALSELHATRKLFLDTIADVSEQQWRWKPSAEAWSVAEVAEHVAVTEDSYWNAIQRNLESPAAPEKRAEIKIADEDVIPRMADRSSKRKTCEGNAPAGRFAGAAQTAAHFRASRDRLIAFVTATDQDLRNRVWPHKAYGALDGYQWVLLACGHIERHVAQIKEVLGAPGFPKQ